MVHWDGKEGTEAAEARVLDVLIVEDDPMIMKMMVLMISRSGHRVITATNGNEAVQLWESERPPVILMDVQMPLMDGLAATRVIRSREGETDCQVAIYGMTGHARQEDVGRCLEAGMTGHIRKPIDFQEVRATIQRHQTDTPQGQERP